MSETPEMVLRVARAMWANRHPHPMARWETDPDEQEKDEYLDLARAAIEAMREPTLEMTRASHGVNWVYYGSHGRGEVEDGAEEIWQAMIDAALTPPRE